MAEEKNKSDNPEGGMKTGIMDFILNLFKPVKALILIHFKFAFLEFKRDSRRFLSGIISAVLGLFFLGMFWLLMNGVVIALFYEYVFSGFLSLRLILSVLSTGGINLLVALILLAASQASLKGGFLSETRKVFKDTVDELKD